MVQSRSKVLGALPSSRGKNKQNTKPISGQPISDPPEAGSLVCSIDNILKQGDSHSDPGH